MAIETNFDTAIVALVNDLASAELIDISNVVFEQAFEVSKLAEKHTVLTNIRNGNIIPIMSKSPNYKSFPYKDPNNCDIPVCDLDLPFKAKPWVTGMIACKIPICINEFSEDFLIFWKQHKRLFGDADLNSALLQFIVEKFQNDLEAAMWRVGYFGDTSISSGDPNYSLLRPADGIFTQAEAMDGYKIEVTENTAGTGLTGEALYNYLNEAYTYASLQPWWKGSNFKFRMTKAMASVFVTWLNSLTDRTAYNCECFSPDGITAQRTFSLEGMLKVFGIPIEVNEEYDGVIAALNLGNPYRALLTADTNTLIGTSELDQLPAFKIWYSEDDDKIYIKGGANIGAALVLNEYVYIGAESASPSV